MFLLSFRSDSACKKLMKLIIPSILLSLLHFSIVIASLDNNIPLGSILYTSNNPTSALWSSSNNKFTLNFIPSSSSSSLFVASISHVGAISVWQAGGADYFVDSGGHFCLHASGDLRLVTSTNSTIWSSGTSGHGVTHALLEDSGNFVLKNGSVSVWSTFENPTDTLVPSQNLTVDTSLQSGIYSLNVTQLGDLVLNWNHSVEYWKLGSNISSTNNLISPSLSISGLGILAVSDKTLSSPVKLIFSADYGEGGDDEDDTFRFLKLESDGNLRIYTYNKNGIIKQQWAALSDQCLVFGYCGEMGICSYNASGPSCRCPSKNFIPVDSNDPRKGCKRKIPMENCSKEISMVQLEHTKFLTFGHGIPSQIFFTASSACRLNCLPNPICIASSSLSDGAVHCYLKKPGFLSGYNSPAFPGTSYIKVCGNVVPNPNPSLSETTRKGNGKRVSALILGLAVLCAVSGLLLLECAVFCCCKKFHGKLITSSTTTTTSDALHQYVSSAPVQFSYDELRKMTKGFTEKLSNGGFGTVYKGKFANKDIAVKNLEGNECSDKLFRMEVATISSTHHINLVKMMGFCSEGRHRLVVYEFMRNGSLASILFHSEETSGKLLYWDFRFRTAISAARGLSYLHESCRECILHCNFKPENILFDENYNAKVSDFGLMDQKGNNFDPNGYFLAPEWVKNSPITPKADVYSFGMVLLELVTGRRSSEMVSDMKLWEWAYGEYENGDSEGLLDKRVVRNEQVKMEQVMRVIEVGFWCLQEEVLVRPTMGKVVQMLEGVVEILKPPAPMGKHGPGEQVKVGNPSSSAHAPSHSFSFPALENI